MYVTSAMQETAKIAVNINQTIAIGDLLVLTAGKASAAGAAPAAGTILGIAAQAITTGGTVTATDTVLYTPIKGKNCVATYTGVTKASLNDADLGKTFDINGKTNVDLDDTTGGFAVCVSYDNTNKTITFVPTEASVV